MRPGEIEKRLRQPQIPQPDKTGVPKRLGPERSRLGAEQFDFFAGHRTPVRLGHHDFAMLLLRPNGNGLKGFLAEALTTLKVTDSRQRRLPAVSHNART
jgi:hypothetical protein